MLGTERLVEDFRLAGRLSAAWLLRPAYPAEKQRRRKANMLRITPRSDITWRQAWSSIFSVLSEDLTKGAF